GRPRRHAPLREEPPLACTRRGPPASCPAVCLVPAPPHRDASCHSLPPAHPGRRSPPCAQIQILCARPVAPTARLTTTPSRRSELVATDLPRAFRTADLWLIHAADCCSRCSSCTCCGVRY